MHSTVRPSAAARPTVRPLVPPIECPTAPTAVRRDAPPSVRGDARGRAVAAWLVRYARRAARAHGDGQRQSSLERLERKQSLDHAPRAAAGAAVAALTVTAPSTTTHDQVADLRLSGSRRHGQGPGRGERVHDEAVDPRHGASGRFKQWPAACRRGAAPGPVHLARPLSVAVARRAAALAGVRRGARVGPAVADLDRARVEGQRRADDAPAVVGAAGALEVGRLAGLAAVDYLVAASRDRAVRAAGGVRCVRVERACAVRFGFGLATSMCSALCAKRQKTWQA